MLIKAFFNYFGNKVDVKVAANGKEKLQFLFNRRFQKNYAINNSE
jgi:hypothetical protein